MRRWGIRLRLTVIVTAAFFVVTSLLSWLAVSAVTEAATQDGRATAQSVLDSALVYGPEATRVASRTSKARYFYTDDNGTPISPRRYSKKVFGEPIKGKFLPGGLILSDQVPIPVDRGEDRVAAAGRLTGLDSREYWMGIEIPVATSHAATRRLGIMLLAAVPLLSLLVAGLTWLATGWALAPVEQIRQRTASITASALSDRVPVPAPRDELRALALTMNQMLERLQRAATRQRQFVTDASHDLRSPVAASVIQLEVALADPGRADWSTVGVAVLEQQRILGRLVDDLLVLSKADEGAPGSAVRAGSEVDFDELVRAECRRSRAVPVTLNRCDPARLLGDEALLSRAVRNLLDNGEQHAGTPLQVTLTVTGGWAELSVDDSGAGIAESERARVLDRFVSLDEARGSGGTGLGLAIVAAAATAHGGTVELAASPTGGLRVRLRVPVAADQFGGEPASDADPSVTDRA